MDTQVEGLRFVRNGPFKGNRTIPLTIFGLERKLRLDAVVISEGDDRRKAKLFNLPALKIEREFGRRGGRPVTLRVFHSHSVIGCGALFMALHETPHERITAANHREKFQRLPGLIGVTME